MRALGAYQAQSSLYVDIVPRIPGPPGRVLAAGVDAGVGAVGEAKESIMLLVNKVAVIYGAGGAIGAAVARAFAQEGAQVFLTGRRRAPLETVAREIADAGGAAAAAEVDALDET